MTKSGLIHGYQRSKGGNDALAFPRSTGEIMKKSTKAALLSTFVFPGVGHFFLKKPVLGLVLSGTALAALYVLMTNAVEKALQIAEKIQSGEVQPDIATITDLVSRQPVGAEAQSLNIATAVLIIAWLGGIADAYRVGHGQDKDIKARD